MALPTIVGKGWIFKFAFEREGVHTIETLTTELNGIVLNAGTINTIDNVNLEFTKQEYVIMATKKTNKQADIQQLYTEQGRLDAHATNVMLRLDMLIEELREFKEDSKARMNKFETWMVGIVAIALTTLLATVGSLLMRLL